MEKNTETTVELTSEILAEIERISKTEGNLSLEDELRLVEIYKLSGENHLGADVMYIKQYEPIRKICVNFAFRHNRYQDIDDYVQDCYEYMLEALDTFKFSKRTRFNTYLSVVLKKCLNDKYYESNNISKYYQQEYYKIGCFIRDYELANGKTPTDEEIMKALGYTPARYNAILLESSYLIPLHIEEVTEREKAYTVDRTKTLTEDIIFDNMALKSDSPESIAIDSELKLKLNALLKDIGPERCDILFRYAGIGYDKPQTKRKICTETGLSKHYVSKTLDYLLEYAREKLGVYYY